MNPTPKHPLTENHSISPVYNIVWSSLPYSPGGILHYNTGIAEGSKHWEGGGGGVDRYFKWIQGHSPLKIFKTNPY